LCFLSILIYLYLLSISFTYMKLSNGARRRSTHARYARGRDGQEASDGSPYRLEIETYGCRTTCMCACTLMLTMAHHTIMTYGEDSTFLYP
jgi:hypothetical protein